MLNVTTKTDTIWSFSSHFTILSSTNASVDPKSEGCSTSFSLPSWVQGIAGVVLQASDLLVVGPPGPLLHPNPGAAHPDEPRLLGGLDSRSFPCAVGGAAVSSGFCGTSSQSSRGARSDRSIIPSAEPPQQSRRGLEMMSQPRGSASIRRQLQIRPVWPLQSCSELVQTPAKYETYQFLCLFYNRSVSEVIINLMLFRG